MEVETTDRGFSFINFRDANGEECSLQQSSAIRGEDGLSNPGSSLIWLGRKENEKPIPPTMEICSPRMHLDREEVKWLVTHLQSWLDTGSFSSDEWPNTIPG